MSSSSNRQKRSKCLLNGVKMAVFFQKKIARIALWLRVSPPGPLTCHFVQNVIQMAIKLR